MTVASNHLVKKITAFVWKTGRLSFFIVFIIKTRYYGNYKQSDLNQIIPRYVFHRITSLL